MLSNIAYQQIDENYCFVKYVNFKVLLMKDSGYINVTKLCKDGNKQFYHWKENAVSKRLIHALECELVQQASEFTPDKPRSPCFAAIGIPREETRSPCSALQIVLTQDKST